MALPNRCYKKHSKKKIHSLCPYHTPRSISGNWLKIICYETVTSQSVALRVIINNCWDMGIKNKQGYACFDGTFHFLFKTLASNATWGVVRAHFQAFPCLLSHLLNVDKKWYPSHTITVRVTWAHICKTLWWCSAYKGPINISYNFYFLQIY